MIIDDYVFIKKYWPDKMLLHLGIWFIYYLMYFITFSFIYWLGYLGIRILIGK